MTKAKKIAERKLKDVEKFSKLVLEYPIVGIVDMENLPAKQLQNMRETLRSTVEIVMTKKRLMRIILENCKDKKKGIEQLEEFIKGMPAMIFTKDNPFKLYKKLDDNKSSAPAKAGQTASNDIVIPAGPTPFSPGPIIGELGALKIKTAIEGGKVAVKEDSTVVKEGEEINSELAGILTRLGIEPMEIGLNLVAVYEEGSIFTKDVLHIDDKEYSDKVNFAASETFNLAMYIGYATEDTIRPLLQKAHMDSIALGKSENIIADELIGDMLAMAESEMMGLKNKLGIEVSEKPVEEVKEEAPAQEEKAEEPKEEEKPEEKTEEAPAEEVKEEAPAQEEKTEEPKEEEKPEETPAEEEKEEAPAQEEKAEEPKEEEKPEEKTEEAPAEDVKEEAPTQEENVEEPKEEEKPEEKTEEAPAEDVKEEAPAQEEKAEEPKEEVLP